MFSCDRTSMIHNYNQRLHIMFKTILYIFAIILSKSTAQCPSQCICLPTVSPTTISCGPGLSSFPANIPVTTEIFSIGVASGGPRHAQNSIPSLSRSNFNSFTNAIRIQITFSNIQTIASGTFSKLSNTKQLDLRGNKLSRLSRSMFSGLNRLESLILTDNPGCVLELNVFDDLLSLTNLELGKLKLTSLGNILSKLKSLNRLDLNGNDIVRLESSSFSALSNLHHLDVSFNDLYEIQEGLKGVLANLLSLNLDYNPWRCNCAMIWLKSLPSKFVFPSQGNGGGVICEEPTSFKYRNLISVLDVDMKCVTPQITSCMASNTGQVIEGQPLDISCIISGDPFPDVTWTRPDGKNISQTLMTSTTDTISISIPASKYSLHNGRWIVTAQNYNGSYTKMINLDIGTTTSSTTTTTPTTTTTTTSTTASKTTSSTSASSSSTSSTKQPAVAAHTSSTLSSSHAVSSHLSMITRTSTPTTVVSHSKSPPINHVTKALLLTTNQNEGTSLHVYITIIIATTLSGCVLLLASCIFVVAVYKTKKKMRIAAKRRSVYSQRDDFVWQSEPDISSLNPRTGDIVYMH